jgi:hypothetical protein
VAASRERNLHLFVVLRHHVLGSQHIHKVCIGRTVDERLYKASNGTTIASYPGPRRELCADDDHLELSRQACSQCRILAAGYWSVSRHMSLTCACGNLQARRVVANHGDTTNNAVSRAKTSVEDGVGLATSD